jgi:hypothetical protein
MDIRKYILQLQISMHDLYLNPSLSDIQKQQLCKYFIICVLFHVLVFYLELLFL